MQCNLIESPYQQDSDVLYTSTPNKSCAYLLNVELRNLAFLTSYNTEFDDIIKKLVDENGRLLEIECKIILTLLINDLDNALEPRIKRYGFSVICEKSIPQICERISNTATKTGIGA